jgi:integrase
MQIVQPAANPKGGRPRTGYVYWHRDHWDVRISLADGKKGKPQHLDPHITEEQARDFAARASALAVAGGATRDRTVLPVETVDAWLQRWTADRKARGIATADATAQRLTKWLSPALRSRPMRAVTREEIETVVERLDKAAHAGKIRPKTAINTWSFVRAAFRDAQRAKTRELRVRLDNPTDGVPGPDGGVERSKPWLYPCEFSALMACPHVLVKWRRLFALATYLYLRAGEVAALTVDDVDLVGGVVLVHRSAPRIGRRAARTDVTTKPTKTMITHRVPIEPTLRPLLAVMIDEARAAGRTRLVDKMPLSEELAFSLRRYLPRAGITRAELFADDETRAPLTFHDLRATGMTWRAVRGDDPLKIQRAVGHRSLGTTQRYIREAEVIGRDIGQPFPPLPAALLTTSPATYLASSLAILATQPAPTPTNQAPRPTYPTGNSTPWASGSAPE